MPLAAGQIVEADDLRGFSVIARGDRSSAFASTTPATNIDVGILRLDNIQLIGGKGYMVIGRFRPTSGTATDRLVGRIRYNDTGVATVSSAEMERTELQSTSTSNTIRVIGWVFPSVDVTASMLLIYMRVGTGAMTLSADAGGSLAQMYVVDCGLAVPDTGVDV